MRALSPDRCTPVSRIQCARTRVSSLRSLPISYHWALFSLPYSCDPSLYGLDSSATPRKMHVAHQPDAHPDL